MPVSPLAGSRPDASLLVDVDALLHAYHGAPEAPVAFGTSGHRGSSIETAEPRRTPHDYVSAYVGDLPNVIDLEAIREAGVRIGADPLGGASLAYFEAIVSRHGLDLSVVNEAIDPTFRFVPVDHD